MSSRLSMVVEIVLIMLRISLGNLLTCKLIFQYFVGMIKSLALALSMTRCVVGSDFAYQCESSFSNNNKIFNIFPFPIIQV